MIFIIFLFVLAKAVSFEQANALRLGRNVTMDMGKAKVMLKAIIEDDHEDKPKALNALGEIEMFMEDVHASLPDFKLARQWFEQAADLGHALAQHNLAFIHAVGLDVPKDTSRAVLYDYFASMGGSHEASMSMGFRHKFGLAVPKSCSSSLQYYKSVSDQVVLRYTDGTLGTQERLSLLVESARSASSTEDKDLVQYYEMSAYAGDTAAQTIMGHIHFYGARGVQRDYPRAREFYIQAAAQDDAAALSHLGTMYLEGLGVDQDNATALHYFTQAAKLGKPSELNGLAYMHLHGIGIPKNPQKALQLYKQAADAGNAEAQFTLGTMYFTGEGVEMSFTSALSYFTMASAQNHVKAMYNLAQLHANGLGTQMSCEKGLELYKSVAERGPWGSSLRTAHQCFLRGEFERSALIYTKHALEGVRIAQTNAAWMLQRGKGISRETGKRIAFVLWELAAEQGDTDSKRMLGDFYYEAEEFEKAAKLYRQAASARDAQASFNLGYMHQYGIGVDADLFLAKRFFDESVEFDAKALAPATLALIPLKLQLLIESPPRLPGISLQIPGGWMVEDLLLSFCVGALGFLIAIRQFQRA